MRLSREALWRRKWLAVEVVLLGALGGAVFTLTQQRVYEATSTARLPQTETRAGEVRLARSRAVLAALGQTMPAHGVTLRALRDHSWVRPRGSPDRLEFHVRDESPPRAAALATAYARTFAAARVKDGHDSNIEAASGAERVAPHPLQAVAVGSLLGVSGALLLIFSLESFDRRVRRSREVTQALDLPLLGALKSTTPSGTTLAAQRYDEAAEAFRILRANVELALIEPRGLVLMVTGAVHGEGRTRTAANLAVACALAGRRVALVDAHLRYPALARLFDLEGHPGLTDVVLRHVPLTTALHHVDLESNAADQRLPVAAHGELDVLTSGPEPIDPADVVASEPVTAILGALRAQYDIVILDAPPLLPVADARILGGIADALIAVVNLDLIRRPMLGELKDAVRACHATPLGVFVNGASRGAHDPYSGHYLPRRRHQIVREWAT